MGRKHAKPEEIIAQLREVDVRLSQGESTAQAIRAIGVSEQTYYRWRREYGGMKIDQARRLKDLEKESEPLRRHWFKPNGERGCVRRWRI